MKSQLTDADGPLWNLSSDFGAVGGAWKVGDIGHVPRTGENFLVTSISGGNVTAVRNVGKNPPNLDYEAAKQLIREVCGEEQAL